LMLRRGISIISAAVEEKRFPIKIVEVRMRADVLSSKPKHA